MDDIIIKYILNNLGWSCYREYYNSDSNCNFVTFEDKIIIKHVFVFELQRVFDISENHSVELIKKTIKTYFNIDVLHFTIDLLCQLPITGKNGLNRLDKYDLSNDLAKQFISELKIKNTINNNLAIQDRIAILQRKYKIPRKTFIIEI